MKIITYNTSDDSINVFKLLFDANEIDITLKNSVELLDPTIVLSGSIPTFNYCYIPEFKRYYYKGEVRKVNNNLYEIQLHVDPLMSFADNIKLSYALIEHNEYVSNNYLPDPSYKSEVRKTTECRNFPNGFNNEPEFILITCGDTL